MEDRSFAAPARDDERFKWLQLLFAVIDRVLQIPDSSLIDVRLGQMPLHLLEVRSGEKRADDEEIALHGHQYFVDAGEGFHCSRHAVYRVKLIDVAISLHTRAVLLNPLHT